MCINVSLRCATKLTNINGLRVKKRSGTLDLMLRWWIGSPTTEMSGYDPELQKISNVPQKIEVFAFLEHIYSSPTQES